MKMILMTANGRLFRSSFEETAELVSAELIENLQNLEDTSRNAAPPRESGAKKSSGGSVGGKKGM